MHLITYDFSPCDHMVTLGRRRCNTIHVLN